MQDFSSGNAFDKTLLFSTEKTQSVHKTFIGIYKSKALLKERFSTLILVFDIYQNKTFSRINNSGKLIF